MKYFYDNKDWALVYFDYDGVIFLKRIPENQDIIERYEMDLTKWEPKKIDLYKLGSVKVTPYQASNRAYTLEAADLDDAALKEIEDVLRVAPNYADPYKLFGKISGKHKEFEKAYEYYRIASVLDPDDMETKANMAQALYDLGKYEEAIKQYNKIIHAQPGQARPYYNLAKAYAQNKQYDEALNVSKRAIRLDSQGSDPIKEVGDILFEQGEYEKAREIYNAGLKMGKSLEMFYHKIGLTYKNQAEFDKAYETFQKGLELNPENEDIQKSLKELERKK